MAHEGFNWKQQSLLACILFSSRVQRTPIISFLLYCLFSSPPVVAGLLAKSSEPATELPFPSFRSPGFDCPPSTHSPRPSVPRRAAPRFLRVSTVSSPVRSPNDLGSRVPVVCRDTPPSDPPPSSRLPRGQDVPQNSCVLQRGREHSSDDEGRATGMKSLRLPI